MQGSYSSGPQNRYNRPRGQLAQLYSWLACSLARRFWILRNAYLALLCVCLFLHRSESVLGLLVIGQFGPAIREAFQGRRPTTD